MPTAVTGVTLGKRVKVKMGMSQMRAAMLIGRPHFPR